MKARFASLGYQEKRVVEGFVQWGGYVIECKDSYDRSAFPGKRHRVLGEQRTPPVRHDSG